MTLPSSLFSSAFYFPAKHCSSGGVARKILRFQQLQFKNNRITHIASGKSFSSLSPKVISRIKQDLIDSDNHKNGMLDVEGLKCIFKKYKHRFSDDDIEKIGDMFSNSSVGGNKSISHESFLEAIQQLSQNETKDNVDTPGSSADTNNSSQNMPQLLSLEIVNKIKQDLVDADVNHDGRVCHEELKAMLQKHGQTLSDLEIEKIGELFFVGNDGKSVRHSTMLRAIQHTFIRRDPKDNPLNLENINDARCWVNKNDKFESFYNVQQNFDHLLRRYVDEKIQEADQAKGDSDDA